MSDTSKAAAYTRKMIKEFGYTPELLSGWVKGWIPPDKLPTLSFYSVWDLLPDDTDEGLVATTKLIQEWVYGAPGDEAAGVEKRAATPKEMDGFLGDGTYRRMLAWQDFRNPPPPPVDIPAGVSYLICNGEKIPVEGVNIVHDKYSFEKYHEDSGKSCFGSWRSEERPQSHSGRLPSTVRCLGTIHWDVCHTSESCFRVLCKSGLSSVFGVDAPDANGNVVVYQWLDFGKHYGWHGGPANKVSFISFDMCNPVDLKYASKHNGKRPIIRADSHGKEKHFLGMFRGQILAVFRIVRAVADRWRKLSCTVPVRDGLPISTVIPDLFDGGWPGVHDHQKITKNKWDVSGLYDQLIYLMRKDPAVAGEFWAIAAQFDVSNDEKWASWEAERDEKWQWPELVS